MRNLFIALTAIFLLSACSGNGETDKLVNIKTSHGEMTVLLYDETPLHKANFIQLAEEGKYDSTIFHRVMSGFMIQGGDTYRSSGGREPEEARLEAEISSKFLHTKGALAAARQPDQVNPEKKSSSCQFYIVQGMPWDQMSIDLNTLHGRFRTMLMDTLKYPQLVETFNDFRSRGDQQGYNEWVLSQKDFVESEFGVELTIEPRTSNNEAYEEAGGGYPPLDGEYTVYGTVVEGLDVIDKIASVKTYNAGPGAQNMPEETIYIEMEVISMSKSEITEKYGYEYPAKEK